MPLPVDLSGRHERPDFARRARLRVSGDVAAPQLVGPVDRQLPQQVRISFLLGGRNRRYSAWKQPF